MTDYDERVNDEADEHAQMIQKQPQVGSDEWLLNVETMFERMDSGEFYEIKDDNNEIND